MEPGFWGYVALSVTWPMLAYTALYAILWRRNASIRQAVRSWAWGVVAFALVYGAQSLLTERLVQGIGVFRFSIPVIETVAGAGYVLWLLYRRQLPDYVAGAAYGTAALLAMSVLDNVFYGIVGGAGEQGLIYTFVRVSTVNNIYGVSGAIAGFGMGMVPYEHTRARKAAWVIGGLVVAAVWRMAYNSLVTAVQSAEMVIFAIIFATTGIALMVATMRSTQARHSLAALKSEKKRADDLLNVIIPLGVSLSAERDFTRMLETIVEQAKKFANADGGTLYLRTADESLEAVVMINEKLNIHARGGDVQTVIVEPLKLFDEAKQPNQTSIAAVVVHRAETLNIRDVYSVAPEYPGPKAFDKKMNYRTTSVLSLPLRSETGKPIGVLQLVNARSPLTREAIPFDATMQQSLESLSALASAALISYIRTETLRREAQDFKVDQTRVAQHVAEITESEFFNTLRDRVKDLNKRRAQAKSESE